MASWKKVALQDGDHIVNEQGRQDHVANTMSSPYYHGDGLTMGDRIDLGAATNFPTGDFTYSVWINPDVLSVGHIGGNYGGGSTSGVQFSVNASGIFSVYIQASISSSTGISAGEWSHVAYTRSGTTVTIYVNGVSDGTGTNSNAIATTGNFYLFNPYAASNNNENFDGSISNARIYNNALTAPEVKELYSGASVPFKYKGASQTELVTGGDMSNAGSWTIDGSNVTINASSNGLLKYDDLGSSNITQDLTIEKGKHYRLELTVSNLSGGNGYLRFSIISDGGIWTKNPFKRVDNDALLDYTSWTAGTHKIDVYAVENATKLGFAFATTYDAGDVDNISLKRIGAVAEYDGSGATSATWYDKSGNNLDGTVTEATLHNKITALDVTDNSTFAGTVGVTGTLTGTHAVFDDANVTLKLINGNDNFYRWLNLDSDNGLYHYYNTTLLMGYNPATTSWDLRGTWAFNSNATVGGTLGVTGNATFAGSVGAGSGGGGTNASDWSICSKSGAGGTIDNNGGAGYFSIGDDYSTGGAILMVRNDGNRGTKGHTFGSSLFKASFTDATAFEINKSGNSTFGGNLTVTGTATITGNLQIGDGASSYPSHSFENDIQTGMYREGSANLAFATGGVMRLDINSAGKATFAGEISVAGVSTLTGNATFTNRLQIIKSADSTNLASSDMCLQVGGLGASGKYNAIGFGYNGGTNVAAIMAYKSTSGAGATRGELGFYTRSVTTDTAPTQRMVIDTSGYVGIGTASPQSNLHIGDTTSTSNIQITNSTTGAASGNGALIGMVGDELQLSLQENSSILFKTNGGTAFTLQSDNDAIFTGKVGIGTTSPDRMLTLDGGASGYPQIHGKTSSYTLFLLEQYYGDEGFLGLYYQGNRTVTIRAKTGEHTYFNAGNVGIGTTSPNTKFIVNAGAAEFSALFTRTGNGDHNVMLNCDNVVNNTNQILFNANTNGYNGGYGESGNTTFAGIEAKLTQVDTQKGQLRFYVNTGDQHTYPLTLLDTGNATFGGNVQLNDKLTINRTGTGATSWTLTTSHYGASDYGSLFLDSNLSTGNFYIRDSSDNVDFTVTGAGNVGIGTASPETLGLHINKASTDTSIDLNDKGHYHLVLQNSDAASTTAGRHVGLFMQINSNSSAADASIYTEFEEDGGAKLHFTTTKSGTGQERMVIDSDGNVGIGTIAPKGKLDVRDAGTLPSSIGTAGTGLNVLRTDGLVGLSIGFVTATNGSYMQSQNLTNTTPYDLLLNPNGGNVGIGTTSPSDYYCKKLVVSGPDNEGITILTESTTGFGGIMFADGTGVNAYRGQFGYDHNDDSMGIWTAAVRALWIDSSQNATFAGTIEGTQVTTTGTGKNNFSGNIAMASGKGIDFSAGTEANEGGTSDDQVLADYETGSWTPALPNGWSHTYDSSTNRYVKIGSLVQLWGRINDFSGSSSTTDLTITGLPFTVKHSAVGGDVMFKDINVYSKANNIASYVNTSEILYFFESASGYDWTKVETADLTSGSDNDIYFSIQYETDQ